MAHNYSNIDQVIMNLRGNPTFSSNIEYWDHINSTGEISEHITDLHPNLEETLNKLGINRLYSHQIEAIKKIRQGNNVVIVTGTASGKSLCYQIPILQSIVEKGYPTALLLFPTKALTYDQLRAINRLEKSLFNDTGISAVYDGDTPSGQRAFIRKNTKILLTNPDMLNIALLPFHTNWREFFTNLKYIVIDELHQYRGVFGSHFCNVLRRLNRILEFYGSKPQFILTSATIGNPQELAELIIERPVHLIDKDSSPKGEKNNILYNPPFINKELGIREGLLTSTTKIGSFLLDNDVQSIIFCQSRRFTELVVKQLHQKYPRIITQIRGYRSGYLKSERREIENGLKTGVVRLVAATNALELGVDIGGADAVVIAGYPGSVNSLKQMAGRAGRSTRTSISIHIASMNPLDQYFARFPQYLFSKPIEKALIDPNNPLILLPHLQSSAFEYPFYEKDLFGKLENEYLHDYLEYLVEQNILQKKKDRYFYLSSVFPAGNYSIRGTAATNIILQLSTEDNIRTIGEIDYSSGLWMCHKGAVYLHDGTEYHVDSLDLSQKIASLSQFSGTYRTEPIKTEQIGINEVEKSTNKQYIEVKFGDINVISQVTGFKKVDNLTSEILGIEPLDMPVSTLNTKGFWIKLNNLCLKTLRENNQWFGGLNDYGPDWNFIRRQVLVRDNYVCQSCGKNNSPLSPLHIHHKIPFKSFVSKFKANELDNLITLCNDCHRLAELNVKIRSSLSGLRYAITNMAPLLVLCDMRDLDAISDPDAPYEDFSPVIMVYDTVPGGVGLSNSLFGNLDLLMQKCYELVSTCSCENGCPSCVGPASENGEGGKSETLFLLSLIGGKNG